MSAPDITHKPHAVSSAFRAVIEGAIMAALIFGPGVALSVIVLGIVKAVTP